MKRTWYYLVNVFLNVTRDSYVKMLSLITDHESKLKAKESDADIQAIIERTTPEFDTYSPQNRINSL